MFESLFFLLPVAAIYGWYMGQRNAIQKQEQTKQQLSERYVAGLNYLFSDQADKAVDLFIELMEVDSDTLETHMALASLFRRRGEVDRAIKIHQNILDRPQLTQEQYDLAVLELARDFSAAGLLDRSIVLYKKLVDKPSYSEPATLELVALLQQLKDWQQAIEFAERLPEQKGMARTVAQLYCELASNPQLNSDKRFKYFKKSLTLDPSCVRANLLMGQMYQSQGEHKQAVQSFQKVLRQDIDFVTEIITPLSESYQILDDDVGYQSFLIQAVEKGAGTSVVIALAERLKEHGLAMDAETLELSQLQRHPSLKGFFHYMEYHLERMVDPEARYSLSTLQNLVGKQLAIKPKYCCRKCGFATNLLQWQCPSCKSWGEIKPVRGLDGE